MKINWEIFFENSSTEEAIAYFAQCKYSFKKFFEACWPKDCKNEINRMKQSGYKKSRQNARKAMSRRNIFYKDWEWIND